MGFVYQGGKAAMRQELLQFLNHYMSDDTPFVELFIGGFNIAPHLCNGKRRVITSDVLPYATSLIDHYVIKKNPIPYKWISSEEFKDLNKNQDKHPIHEVAYARFFWSFSAKGTSYFASKEREVFFKFVWDVIFNEIPRLNLSPKDFLATKLVFHDTTRDLLFKLWTTNNEPEKIEEWNKWFAFVTELDESNLRLPFFSLIKHLEDMQNMPFQDTMETHINDYRETNIPEGAVVYCFDKDTEVLTDSGWKFFKDCTMNDTFLSRNPDTNELDYVRPVSFVEPYVVDKMWSYKSSGIDLMTTLDHNLFMMKTFGRNKAIKHVKVKPGDLVNRSHHFISAGGVWTSTSPDTFDFCGNNINFVDFAYLLGIFLTDGSINKRDIVTISQTKEDVRKSIIDTLDRLGLDYSVYHSSIYLPAKYNSFFKPFYLKSTRRVPDYIRFASSEVILSFLHGIIDGDGDNSHEDHLGLFGSRRVTCQTKDFADDICELLFKVGMAGAVRMLPLKTRSIDGRLIVNKVNAWQVSILNQPYKDYIASNSSIVDYNDLVYCVSLEKWNTVLVRRNGNCSWQGQCDPPYRNTSGYGVKFDFNGFDNYMRELSKTNIVFISEYSMPEDFVPIFEIERDNKLSRSSKNSKVATVTEVVYVHKSLLDSGRVKTYKPEAQTSFSLFDD